VSPISIYVIILITLAPVLGKRMITLPPPMITMITFPYTALPPAPPAPLPRTAQQSVQTGKNGKSGTISH
jgi:hypothetical protein